MGATLYDSQGFENPPFALGNLNGQQGYTRFDTDSPTADDSTVPMTVQSGVVLGGTQAVQITSTTQSPGDGFIFDDASYAIKPISLANIATSGTPQVTVSWDMRVDDSASRAGVWGVQVYDTTPGGSGGPNSYAFAGIGNDANTNQELTKVSAADGNTVVAPGPSGTLGDWHNYVLDMNFQQGLYSLTVDGSLYTIGALNLANTDGNLGEVDFFTSGRGLDTAYFDNLLVTSGTALVPEPTSMALFGLGGLALLGRRRARRA
jgi:hypothetical protein